MKESAGILIIYNNKILLCHSTNQNWKKNGYSIPKGHIDKGETIKQAAIRETKEEVGINIKSNQLNSKIYSIEYKKGGEVYKIVHYYVLLIKDLKEIGLSSEVIPKSQLQLAEVDWAGFLEYNDAQKKIFKVMSDMLLHLNESKYYKLHNFNNYNE